MTDEAPSARRRLARWLPSASLLAALAVAAAVVPSVVTLFFVAVLVVYLIEPVVGSIASRSIAGRRVPRWGAVVLVYTGMLATSAAFAAIVVPQVAREAAALATELPGRVRDVRAVYLPRLAERVGAFQRALTPEDPRPAHVDAARAVSRAITEADDATTAELARLGVQRDVADTDRAGVLFRIRTTAKGDIEILAGSDPVALRPTGDGAFVVTQASHLADPVEAEEIDLERAVNASVARALDASGEQLTNLLQASQFLLGKLVSAVVALFVTFMVAAFIAIDAQRLTTFIVELFPRDDERAVRRLLAMLNLGLAGVVRGQLGICVVNGILTGVGLLLFDVKFAFLLAALATVLSLIPIFGTIISSVPIVVFAAADGLTKPAIMIVWILFIHFIEANLLNPKIVGTAARIHPVLVIFSLLAGERIAGIVGALVAVPTVSILQSLFLFARDEYRQESSHVVAEPARDLQPTEGPHAS